MGLCPLQQGFTLWNKTWHQHHAQIIQQLLLLNATVLTNREWMHQCPSDITAQGVRESVRRCLYCLFWFPQRDKSVIMCTEPCPLVTRQDFHFSNRKTQTVMHSHHSPCITRNYDFKSLNFLSWSDKKAEELWVYVSVGKKTEEFPRSITITHCWSLPWVTCKVLSLHCLHYHNLHTCRIKGSLCFLH